MNKRKIMLLAVSLCMVAILGFGSTLAYLSDTDNQVNVFTTGDVKIDLYEDFGDNDDTTLEKLMPATGSAQDGTLQNGIEKEVYVKNIGSEDAYVRVHIAIPTILDDGDPTFNAMANTLHFNYDKASIGEGKWDWSKAYDDGKYEGNWNFYKTTIEGVVYNVYVVTYTGVLSTDDATEDAMKQVYLDSKVTNDQIANIKNAIGKEWKIYVAAEGGQVAGFANAYEALNEQFGTPGTEGYVAPAFLAGAKGDTWVNVD